ncbi:ferric reductase NAD binding domain-containing protein [Phlebopus sp. FC_14]|nr:ferric reductase NAD binding domain-containing protein [Phlebopus sp. FC_14]
MSAFMDTTTLAAATGPTDKTIRVSRNKLYPIQAWYCIAIFLFIIGIFQWSSFLHSKFVRRRSASGADEELASSPARDFSLRRIPVALANAFRVIAFRWTLDVGKSYTLNMAEVFITVAYIVFLYVWVFINTTDLEHHKFVLKYWCNRAGTLATSQFVLITALGTKNNLVTLVTGISYGKLNYIHRMTARVVLVLLWVHTGGEIVANTPLKAILKEPWLICGFVGVIALTILCMISVRPIRAAAYEVFFYAHFAMVLIFLVCSYVHTQYASMTYWVYPCFVIWGLDRLIRVIRLVLFNHLYFGFSSGSKMDATIELLSEDVVRLHFHRPPHFHWTPGQTAYLIMPTVSRVPFEAHPFTIASFDSNLFESIEEDRTSLEERGLGSSLPFWKEVVFFINVREGFTARLKEAALRGRKVKVLLDGPYGPTPDLGSYNTSVLIAGGSGVSYTLPAFLDIIERVRGGKSDCRRVVFIWSIRDPNYMHWIDDMLIRALQLAPPSLSISIRINVTGASGTIEPLPRLDRCGSEKDSDARVPDDGSLSEITDSELDNGRKSGEKSKDSLLALDFVKVENGRPDLPAMLREEVECTSGRMSVSVCGSQAIARCVRRALRFPVSSPLNVLNGGPSVTLHVESFGYA